jgi:hypothetical protein
VCWRAGESPRLTAESVGLRPFGRGPGSTPPDSLTWPCVRPQRQRIQTGGILNLLAHVKARAHDDSPYGMSTLFPPDQSGRLTALPKGFWLHDTVGGTRHILKAGEVPMSCDADDKAVERHVMVWLHRSQSLRQRTPVAAGPCRSRCQRGAPGAERLSLSQSKSNHGPSEGLRCVVGAWPARRPGTGRIARLRLPLPRCRRIS